MKKAFPYILTIAIVLIGLLIIFMPSKTSGLPSSATLFVGEGCPHCKKVEDFVASSTLKNKYTFDTKEVWHNQDNALVMNKVWQHCGLTGGANDMTVPLFWDGASCYKGDVEIINFLQTKL